MPYSEVARMVHALRMAGSTVLRWPTGRGSWLVADFEGWFDEAAEFIEEACNTMVVPGGVIDDNAVSPGDQCNCMDSLLSRGLLVPRWTGRRAYPLFEFVIGDQYGEVREEFWGRMRRSPMELENPPCDIAMNVLTQRVQEDRFYHWDRSVNARE